MRDLLHILVPIVLLLLAVGGLYRFGELLLGWSGGWALLASIVGVIALGVVWDHTRPRLGR